MNSLAFATIAQLRTKLLKKELSRDEMLSFFIERLHAFDDQLDATLEVYDKEIILKASPDQGLLQGIPGIIKNNISVQGQKVTCASKILENYRSIYDATAISRLKAEGALLAAAGNMDEFAMGSSTETSAFKKTKNPWDTSRVPGGSSGGSAAAVAAGLVPWGLGSDTGGSVRQPAAFCGIVGLKPTYGLVSRYGLVAYGSSLDQIGTFTRSVYDAALLLSIMAGQDERDSSSLAQSKKDYTTNLDGALPHNLKIGVIDNALQSEGMDSEVQQSVENAIKTLESLGATIKRVSLPTLDYTAAAYFIISRAEAASNLARFDGVRYGLRSPGVKSLEEMYSKTRHDGFGDEVRARIMVGNYVLSTGHADEYYAKAKTVQRLIRREFVDTFSDVDLLIMPTHPAPAFKIGAYDMDKLQIDLQDYFTCPMNLAGIPAISLPCGLTTSQLPIGFQLVGPHLSEELLFKVGHAYQQATDWHQKHPTGF